MIVRALLAASIAVGASLAPRATPSPAAPPSPAPAAATTGSLAPIDVRASRTVLELKGKQRHAHLAGSVVARQADLTLRAPEVDATLAPGSRGIERIIAMQGVEVTQGTKVAAAGRAEFDNVARTIVLTKAPRLWDGDNLVEGTRIVLHVDDRTVECFECSVDVDPSKASEVKSFLPGGGDGAAPESPEKTPGGDGS